MTREGYGAIEKIMLSYMEDSAHDTQHVYRVLGSALKIAKAHPEAELDVLVAACLLHDIGRGVQNRNPGVSHAEAGAEMALQHLLALGWDAARAGRVADAVRAHRFRSDAPPETIEAKILYDADKLEVAGAMGVARTLLYQGAMGEPLYRVDGRGEALDGHEDEPGFMNEYVYKLSRLYGGFFTPEAEAMAAPRAKAARDFYENLLGEARSASPLAARLNEVLL